MLKMTAYLDQPLLTCVHCCGLCFAIMFRMLKSSSYVERMKMPVRESVEPYKDQC